MKFQAEIDVMPLKALLDPQGKSVTTTLRNIGYIGIDNVRMGKHISLEIEAKDEKQAHQLIDEACKSILSNPVMENYEFRLIAI